MDVVVQMKNIDTVDVKLLDTQIRSFSKLIDLEKPDSNMDGLYEMLCNIYEKLVEHGEIVLQGVIET